MPRPLEVEVDVLAACDLEEALPRRDRELRGGHRIGLVMGNVGDEFRQPGIFMPARREIERERRIPARQPLDPFDHRRPGVPHFGVAGRELTAIGERGFHGGVALTIEDRHGEAPVEERVGCRDTGDTGADDGDVVHGGHLVRMGRRENQTTSPAILASSPLCHGYLRDCPSGFGRLPLRRTP